MATLERVCHECGLLKSDGEAGEPGTEHAQFWYCRDCWRAWDIADGKVPQGEPQPPPDLKASQPEFSVSYEPPIALPDVALLQGAAQRLVAIADAAAREEAVQTVFKLLDAIIAAPEEIKKRKVKKTNATFHKKVGRHTAALELLRVAGFAEAEDPEAEGGSGQGALLVMPTAYIMRLTDAHHILSSVATKAGIKAPALPQVQGSSGIFNPSQASQQLTGPAGPLTKKAWDGKSEADRLREEVKKKEQKLLEQAIAEPVPLQPVAFWLAAGRRLEDAVREAAAQLTPEERAADSELIKDQAKQAVAAAKASNSKQFESADKARLAELSRKGAHGLCILRVVCPDKSVLQVRFRAGDRGQYVVEQLGPLLAPHVRTASWYVYQTPPLRRLVMTESLAAAGLVPGASLYLGFDGDKPGPPFLEESLVKELGPLPQPAPTPQPQEPSDVAEE